MADENRLARAEQPDTAPTRAGEQERAPSTPEQAAAFEERFYRLIERRTAIYTMGDSTSVPKHVAVDILRSVGFVLGIDPENPEIPERLLTADLEDEYRRNLAELERKVDLSGQLWREVVATMPAIPSRALHDTVAAIGDFPKAYDFRSMAHEIPISFDYPLCHWVSTELLGVDYINEYLRRLLGEADFLRRFDADACVRVLERTSPDYVELLVNLYEPVATNAIGRALIERDPAGLRISDAGRIEIARRLAPLSETERKRALCEAAERVCDTMGVSDAAARDYLRLLAPELLPRIAVGLERGDLGGVFV